MCHDLIRSLSIMFPVKNLGDAKYFLGLELTRTSDGQAICQTKYIQDLLRAKMTNAKPASTPISTSSQSMQTPGDPLQDPYEYRSLVGGLQHLTWTRPDISFAVNKVCQHMKAPIDVHLTAVKKILRYLKGSICHGLFYTRSSLHLHTFSDANWAGSLEDRRSTSGFCIYLGANPISLSAKKQTTVARSSTEAEYRSLAHTAAEICWVTHHLRELHIPLPQPPTLHCDNLGALALATNPVFHARTKHVEIDYHFIQDLVTLNTFVFNIYVPKTIRQASSQKLYLLLVSSFC